MSNLKKRIIKAIDAYLKAEKAMFSSSKWKIFSLAWLIIAIVFFGWNLSLISDGISLRAAAESQQVIEENDSYEKIEDTTQSQSDDSVQLEINNQVAPTGTVTSDSEADFVAKADQANNLSRSVPTGDSHKLFF